MADYPISKEAVLRKLLDLKKSLGCRYISIGLDMALASFDGFPQMDAVPVIRCKDCECSTCIGSIWNVHCVQYDIDVPNDGFCYKAERK